MKHGAIAVFLLAALTLSSCTNKPEVIFRSPEKVSSSPSSRTSPPSLSSESSESSESSASSRRARSVLIDVPFQPQAPFRNWDPLHEEACEEASLLLVHHYLSEKPLTEARMEEEIQELVAWEESHGYEIDVTIAELAVIAQQKYGYRTRILENVTAETLEAELAQGNPVIAPFAGRDLGNPYFSGEGPWYHMLVVIGFDDDEFITNDVGTRRGKQYRYRKDVLLNALHDWNGVKEEIRGGAKRALVLLP